jgi:hypothetical protein
MFTLGYAQDHQFYLLPTNLRGARPPFPGFSNPQAPDDYNDFAFSYLQGGYEASLSPWGYRMGDFLVARAIEAAGLMLGAPVELTLPPVKPSQFPDRSAAPFPSDVSDAARVGQVTLEMPERVKRMEAVEFAWIGGDPGAEMPQAPRLVLEREQAGGQFEEVKTPATRAYDNRTARIITRLRRSGDQWEWVAYWEEAKDFEAGRYRFKAEGHYFNAARERVAYTATSRVFEVVGNDAMDVSVSADATHISATLLYPQPEAINFPRLAEDRGKVTGSYRMRHPEVPSGVADSPVIERDVRGQDVSVQITRTTGMFNVTLTGADVTLLAQTRQVSNRDGVPVTRARVAWPNNAQAGTYNVTVTVTDRHGNTGSATTQLTR